MNKTRTELPVGDKSEFDVSAIIVNWNTKNLLLNSVKSLYEETRDRSLEIIVVDNGSTDGSMDALEERFPLTVRICNGENLGFSKANNIGIQAARGRYICLINSDVKALDHVIDRLVSFMDGSLDVGAVAPKTVDGNMILNRDCREFPTLRNQICQSLFLDRLFPGMRLFRSRELVGYDYETPKESEALSGCFLMVRREVISQVGLLDERFFFYWEDVDWCKRIHDAGWKLVYYPPAVSIHYGGASSIVAPVRFQIEMVKADLLYWKKHMGPARSAVFWGLCVLGSAIRYGGWFLVRMLHLKAPEYCTGYVKGYWGRLSWLLLNGIREIMFQRVDPSKI